MVSLEQLGLKIGANGGFSVCNTDEAMLSAHFRKPVKTKIDIDEGPLEFKVNVMKKKRDVNPFEGLDASEILDYIKEHKPGTGKVRKAFKTLADKLEEDADSDF